MNRQTQMAIELAKAIALATHGLRRAASALVALTESDGARACSWMLYEVTYRASELASGLARGQVKVGDISVDSTCDVAAAIDVVARALKGMAWVSTRWGGEGNYAQLANALEYTSKSAEELEQWLRHNAAKSFQEPEGGAR